MQIHETKNAKRCKIPQPRDNDLRVNGIKRGRITIHQPNKMMPDRNIQKKNPNREDLRSQILFGKGNKIGSKSG